MTGPTDPLDPWAAAAPPTPVEEAPAPDGPPVAPPTELPPAPGPLKTWADEPSTEPVPMPQEPVQEDTTAQN